MTANQRGVCRVQRNRGVSRGCQRQAPLSTLARSVWKMSHGLFIRRAAQCVGRVTSGTVGRSRIKREQGQVDVKGKGGKAKDSQAAETGPAGGEQAEEGEGGRSPLLRRRPKEAPKEEKPKARPRPPADPRLKVLKKFHGKFLPRGPLRDRHKALMARWDSGEDHGGVTVEELKSLHQDWKAARTKPPRKVAASGLT